MTRRCSAQRPAHAARARASATLGGSPPVPTAAPLHTYHNMTCRFLLFLSPPPNHSSSTLLSCEYGSGTPAVDANNGDHHDARPRPPPADHDADAPSSLFFVHYVRALSVPSLSLSSFRASTYARHRYHLRSCPRLRLDHRTAFTHHSCSSRRINSLLAFTASRCS